MGVSSSDAENTLRGYAGGQRVFGRYTLNKIIGRGGMGVVWRARDETLGEEIALKFLPDAVRWDPGAFEDLKAETRRARQLTHPNIVRIHDFVEDASAAAISMELVDGRTLTELRLEKGNKILEPADITPWLPQLCAALDYAHTQAKVVHRDIKPSNLMLTREGVLKIADFGVARSLLDSVTRVSMMSAGTLVYMSPQQAMGEEPSPADDIYSLGATLYELLAGKPPFHTGDVRVQLFQRKPDSIAARRRALHIGGDAAGVPPTWEKTIAACLAKDASERPRLAGEIVVRLAALPGVRRKWLRRPTRRESFLAAGAAVLVGWGALSSSRFFSSTSPVVGFPSDATRALAAWNFDGDTIDASGHGLDGLASRVTPTEDRFGRIDRALHLNGNAEIVVGDSPLLRWDGAQAFSAAVWVRQAQSGSPSGDVWRSAGENVGSLVWSLGFTRGRPACSVSRLQKDQYGEVAEAVAGHPIAAGVWHHLALVCDGMALRLFLDGLDAASASLGINRNATAPKSVAFRFGRPERLSPWAFSGDIDDARVWGRALSSAEIAALAARQAPTRYVLSRGTYVETDDFPTALRAEFGAKSSLADWNEIKREHSDDVWGWSDHIGLRTGAAGAWLQRGGQRLFDQKRHYFATRFDGTKPDYFSAHDELGGMGLALGSWYGDSTRFIAALPATVPRIEALSSSGEEPIRRDVRFGDDVEAAAVQWRLMVTRESSEPMTATLVMRDGRQYRAQWQCEAGDKLVVTLGPTGDRPQTRHIAGTFGECQFALIMRDGRIAFRATSVVGENPVFEEATILPEFRLRDAAALELLGSTHSRLAAATLVVE